MRFVAHGPLIYAVKHYKDCNTKLDHAKLLSLNMHAKLGTILGKITAQ